MTKRYLEPKGFDITNTYKIDIGIKEEAKPLFSDNEKLPSLHDDFWTMMDRIKNHNSIEALCLSRSCYPYTGSFSGDGFSVDTVKGWAQLKEVSPDFFNVFKVGIEKGKIFDWADNQVIISGDDKNIFLEHQVETINEIKSLNNDNLYKVTGIAQKGKRSEFQEYWGMVYRPLDKNNLNIPMLDICIRVKAGANKNFVENFIQDMETQLDIGPYFLTTITPLAKEREQFLDWTGFGDDLKSIYSVSAFLIANIFLGILGTFWFRMQSKRNEIGLRIALGASKSNIKKMYLAETFLLLLISSILAVAICLNISAADILKEIGLPFIDRSSPYIGKIQPLINYILTFVFLALISFIAVWYPARKASLVQPAEALKEE